MRGWVKVGDIRRSATILLRTKWLKSFLSGKGKKRKELRGVRLRIMGGKSKVLQDQFPMSGIFMYN